jgi:putative membrane protein
MWGWNPWWHWLVMAGWWVLVLVVVVWVASRLFPAQRPGAREVLDRRLATGEIDLEEYRRLRDELERR